MGIIYDVSNNTIIETNEQQEVQQNILIKQQIQQEIASLKADLSNTDYKITKCMEYQLAELELPYNAQELHTTRQTLRDRINELESEMS